ncbi:MAG: DUF4282 domain-containing protein [Pirellulales bacterium]|nr:DUF4282 domain-containing protein [Pirellulales bacterium]
MEDFLKFKKMVTPIIIQVLFWLGVIACVLAGIVQLLNGDVFGLLTLIIGPLGVRVYCEILIVIFSINDTLTEIKNKSQ